MPKKRTREYKQVHGAITNVNEDEGLVTAIFSVFGNVDLGKDRVCPGAFAKTFNERSGDILVLDQHRTQSTTDVVAKPVAFRELTRDELPEDLLARYPNAVGGAEATLKFEPDGSKDAKSSQVFYRIKNEWINQWSFGYDAIDINFTDETIDGKDITVRNLRTIKLYEVSPVLWGMNPATATTGAKDMKPWDIFEEGGEYCVYKIDEEGNKIGDHIGDCHPSRDEAEDHLAALYASEEDSAKGATGKTDLPLASRERSWDGAAARKRMETRAGGADSDDMDWTMYRQGFFWYDGENPDQLGSYKLPFADVIDGELKAVPEGVFTVARALSGSRGGVDIPSGDVSGIKAKVKRYYSKMREEFDDDSIEVPWDKSAEEEVETNKSVNLSDYIESVQAAFSAQFPDDWDNGLWYRVWPVYDDHIIVSRHNEDGSTYFQINYTLDENGDCVFASEWVEGDLQFVPLGQELAGTTVVAEVPELIERIEQLEKQVEQLTPPPEGAGDNVDAENEPKEQAGPGSTPPTSLLLDIDEALLEIEENL